MTAPTLAPYPRLPMPGVPCTLCGHPADHLRLDWPQIVHQSRHLPNCPMPPITSTRR